MPRTATVTLLDQATYLESTVRLEVEICCACHVPFGMPESLKKRARSDPSIWFYCPNGHHQHYPGETEEDKLRKKLQAATRRADMAESSLRTERDNRKTVERQAAAYKGQATKMRNRAAAGLCPAGCRRNFVNMKRHLADKHPGFREEEPAV